MKLRFLSLFLATATIALGADTNIHNAKRTGTLDLSGVRGSLSAMAQGEGAVWLAARTDGGAGDGSRENPYDASTAAKHDAILRSLPAGPLVIHYGEGTFLTNGCPVAYTYMSSDDKATWARQKKNWSLLGQPGYRTTLKLADGAVLTDVQIAQLTDTAVGAFTAAISDVCTRTAHGLTVGTPVLLTTRRSFTRPSKLPTGTLPGGLSLATVYWVRTVPSADTFTLGATSGAGSDVNITDTGTGTHTISRVGYPISAWQVFGAAYADDDGIDAGLGTSQMTGSFLMQDIVLDCNRAGQHANSYIRGAQLRCPDITYRRVRVINGSGYGGEQFALVGQTIVGEGWCAFEDCEVRDFEAPGGLVGFTAGTEAVASVKLRGHMIGCRFDGGGDPHTYGYGVGSSGYRVENCTALNCYNFALIDTGTFEGISFIGNYGEVAGTGITVGLGGSYSAHNILIANNQFRLKTGAHGFYLGGNSTGTIVNNIIAFERNVSTFTGFSVTTTSAGTNNAWHVAGNRFDSRLANSQARTLTGSSNTTLTGAAFGGLPETFATAAAMAAADAALAANIPAPPTNYQSIDPDDHTLYRAADGLKIGDLVIEGGATWRVINTTLLSPDGVTPASPGAWELLYGASTVAALPSAAKAGAGARYAATDSNATQAAGLGNTVAGGGVNFVSLTSDGTVWKIQ